MTTFTNRVALITGAGSGIGRQLALLLAGEGAAVAALDLRADLLDALAKDLQARRVATAATDVTDLASVRTAVAQVEGQLGPTDLLIACAGVGRETSALDFRAEDVRATLDVNLTGVVNSIDAVLAGMRQRRGGHLVALSSLASYRGLPRLGAYCASKAGVNALMDSMRVELRPLGIACTTVCPGWVRTPMTAQLEKDVPGLRMMEVRDAARVVLEAVRARRPFVAFPARNAWEVRLLRYLPRPLSDWLCERRMRRVVTGPIPQ